MVGAAGQMNATAADLDEEQDVQPGQPDGIDDEEVGGEQYPRGHHLARHQAAAAIPLLERALEREPDREEFARKLRPACLETGQMARAAEIQKTNALV